jgi:hypothetical protein
MPRVRQPQGERSARRAEALAKANERDIIQRIDLPIAQGLQESILQFAKLEAELEPVLERITTCGRSPTSSPTTSSAMPALDPDAGRSPSSST